MRRQARGLVTRNQQCRRQQTYACHQRSAHPRCRSRR